MENFGELTAFLQRLVDFSNGAYGHITGPVNFLMYSLMTISVVLSFLFAAMNPSGNIIATLVSKTLLFGFIVWAVADWPHLMDVVFGSAAQLGLMAGGNTATAINLQDPGTIAAVGVRLASCEFEWVHQLSGPIGFFENFEQITVLLICGVGIWIAFSIMAIMVILNIVWMKILAIAAFCLVPFAVFEKTSWLADHSFRFVAAAALKILIMALVLSWAMTMISPNVPVGTCAETPPNMQFAMATEAVVFCLLALLWTLPSAASALMTGGMPIGLHGMGMAAMRGAGSLGRTAAGGYGRALSSSAPSADLIATRTAVAPPPPLPPTLPPRP